MNSTDLSRNLNIAAISVRTQALGPGIRAAIWVQGCPFHCPGCVAPEWIPFIPAMKLRPEQILERIDLNEIRGLTFSGGEPMQQAFGLASLARLARKAKDLDVICFTGYRYQHLLQNPPNPGVAGLLAEVDVLIDGPYIQSLNDSVGLRGSSNQSIIHLTSRLNMFDLESSTRKIEIAITNGELGFVGIPTPAITSAMKRIPLVNTERSEPDEWI